jgi:hypothetical protein
MTFQPAARDKARYAWFRQYSTLIQTLLIMEMAYEYN